MIKEYKNWLKLILSENEEDVIFGIAIAKEAYFQRSDVIKLLCAIYWSTPINTELDKVLDELSDTNKKFGDKLDISYEIPKGDDLELIKEYREKYLI